MVEESSYVLWTEYMKGIACICRKSWHQNLMRSRNKILLICGYEYFRIFFWLWLQFQGQNSPKFSVNKLGHETHGCNEVAVTMFQVRIKKRVSNTLYVILQFQLLSRPLQLPCRMNARQCWMICTVDSIVLSRQVLTCCLTGYHWSSFSVNPMVRHYFCISWVTSRQTNRRYSPLQRFHWLGVRTPTVRDS